MMDVRFSWIQTHENMLRSIGLFFLLLAAAIVFADEQPSTDFAICPSTTNGSPGAKFYEFERAVKLLDQPDRIEGYHATAPVITLAGVESVNSFWTEVGAAPWPALKVRFTRAGFRTLKGAVNDKHNRDHVIIIAGKAMARIKGAELAKIAAKKVALIILLAQESGQQNDQLAQKITAAIKGARR